MTVAELIIELQKFPPDKDIGIRDADTSWWGPVIHIEEFDEQVELSIEYPEMRSKL